MKKENKVKKMPDKPILADFLCSVCGHAWAMELPAGDDTQDSLCPKCGKESGKRVG
jgi:rubrerythrin